MPNSEHVRILHYDRDECPRASVHHATNHERSVLHAQRNVRTELGPKTIVRKFFVATFSSLRNIVSSLVSIAPTRSGAPAFAKLVLFPDVPAIVMVMRFPVR
jgi:hypothetical protein